MGKELEEFVPNMIAAPKRNRSIFRLNRDTRFRNDKAPYKTNQGIYFWKGPHSRLESSGCYFHPEPRCFS